MAHTEKKEVHGCYKRCISDKIKTIKLKKTWRSHTGTYVANNHIIFNYIKRKQSHIELLITTCVSHFGHADTSNLAKSATCIQRLGNLEDDTADRDSKENLCLPIRERYRELIHSAKTMGKKL